MAATRDYSHNEEVLIKKEHPTYGGQSATVLASVYYLTTTKLWVRPAGGSPILIEEEFLEKVAKAKLKKSKVKESS